LQSKSFLGLISDNNKKINDLTIIPPSEANIYIMYAIVEIAGQQFKVEKERKVYVHRLDKNVGDVVEFERVLLVEDEGTVKIGTPEVKGAKVTAKVLEHVRGDKVIIFKKKRRKGYQKRSGHRQNFTQILIESITL